MRLGGGGPFDVLGKEITSQGSGLQGEMKEDRKRLGWHRKHAVGEEKKENSRSSSHKKPQRKGVPWAKDLTSRGLSIFIWKGGIILQPNFLLLWGLNETHGEVVPVTQSVLSKM